MADLTGVGAAKVDIENAAAKADGNATLKTGDNVETAVMADHAVDTAVARAANTTAGAGSWIPGTLDSFSAYYDFAIGAYALWKPLAYRWNGRELEAVEVEAPAALADGTWLCEVLDEGGGPVVRVVRAEDEGQRGRVSEANAIPIARIDTAGNPPVTQYHTGALVVNAEDGSSSWMSSSLASSMSSSSASSAQGSESGPEEIEVVTSVHYDGGRLYYYTRKITAYVEGERGAHNITQAVPHCCE